MVNDVARVEFERIFLCGSFRQNDGGVQRTQTAGCAMCDEVDISKMVRVAFKIGRSCGLSTCKHYAPSGSEMLFNIFDFYSCFRQLGVIGIGRDGIADEEELTRIRIS